MKVLVGTDVEGVAGIASLADQSGADGRYYAQARAPGHRAEVNAAVSRLLTAGAARSARSACGNQNHAGRSTTTR